MRRLMVLILALLPSAAHAHEWQPSVHFSGTGTQTTAPFESLAPSFRLTMEPGPSRFGEPHLCVMVHRMERKHVGSGCTTTPGTTHVYVGPGTYYLEVISANPWAITVEDQA